MQIYYLLQMSNGILTILCNEMLFSCENTDGTLENRTLIIYLQCVKIK